MKGRDFRRRPCCGPHRLSVDSVDIQSVPFIVRIPSQFTTSWAFELASHNKLCETYVHILYFCSHPLLSRSIAGASRDGFRLGNSRPVPECATAIQAPGSVIGDGHGLVCSQEPLLGKVHDAQFKGSCSGSDPRSACQPRCGRSSHADRALFLPGGCRPV